MIRCSVFFFWILQKKTNSPSSRILRGHGQSSRREDGTGGHGGAERGQKGAPKRAQESGGRRCRERRRPGTSARARALCRCSRHVRADGIPVGARRRRRRAGIHQLLPGHRAPPRCVLGPIAAARGRRSTFSNQPIAPPVRVRMPPVRHTQDILCTDRCAD